MDEIRYSLMARYTGQGLIDSNYPSPTTEFGIQTEGSTYGELDVQVTANTTYQRYNYKHHDGLTYHDFNGTSQYAKKDTLTPYRSSDTQGTWLGWFRLDALTGRCFVSINDTGGNQNYFQWGLHQSKLYVQHLIGGTANRVQGSIVLSTDKWYLVALTSDTSDWAMYVNGVKDTALTVVDGSNNGDWADSVVGADNVVVGARVINSAGDYFDGQVAQVGIWGGSSGTTGVLSDAQISAIYDLGPGADWTTSYGTGLVDYWTFGAKTTEGTDTGDLVYSQINGSANDLAMYTTAGTYSQAEPVLLIHSHEDIDGDTSIVDSSLSAHLIDRVVSDPVYHTRPAALTGLPNQAANTCIYGNNITLDYLTVPHDNSLAAGTGQFTIAGWVYFDSEQGSYMDLWKKGGSFQFGRQVANDKMYVFISDLSFASDSTFALDTWHHIALTRSGTELQIWKNGADDGTSSGTNWNADVTYPAASANVVSGTGSTAEVYSDQLLFYTGVALSSTYMGHLYASGAGATKFGTLGGVILHEEYANTSVTANAATAILLHSNNATHHTKGSRKFYNDVANTKFTTTTGHEAAGRFTIGASSGIFTVLGAHQTAHSSPGMNNPLIRLKRGYSYIFSASSLSSHKLYFANSTASTTGTTAGNPYAADTALNNQYIGGQYGTNSAVDGTETWTVLDAGQYLGGNGTSVGQWAHMKFEVPIDAPKDLYYRCAVSGHEAMGNAAFIMEATEPAPVKVGTLPALKTSTWNDRDYAGIGTNKSVAKFTAGREASASTSGNYLQMADHADWDLPASNWTIEFWANLPQTTGDGTYATLVSHGGFSHETDANGWSISTHNTGYMMFFSKHSGSANPEVQFTLATAGVVSHSWNHYVWTRDSSNLKAYVNGVEAATSGTAWSAVTSGTSPLRIGHGHETQRFFDGFMDEIVISKVAYNANTVIERYQTGRAGNHYTANSSCVLHLKADSTYGDTVFTDSSPSAHTITNVGGVFHHIDDNRTANTALYFDGLSYIAIPHAINSDPVASSYTYEAWIKPSKMNAYNAVYSKGGHGTADDVSGITMLFTSAGELKVPWYSGSTGRVGPESAAGEIKLGVWQHVAITRTVEEGATGTSKIFINGVCKKIITNAYCDDDHDTGTAIFYIGANHEKNYFMTGWIDGFRMTKGMPRYTSGIPVDGQSPHKRYDDGRSANISSNTWATSSTRQYYGINTHTYLQTTKHATNANTVLLIRGDDAETANNGINMYGDEGFHLEFKEVGAGTERDYNNFNTGVTGLGSDTSATGEFADEATILLLESRPNQANGSTTQINEVTQKEFRTDAPSPLPYHSAAKSIFGITSNTANVSIASGGTRNY